VFSGYVFTQADVENGRHPFSPLDHVIATG
jgi:hypothetical protein